MATISEVLSRLKSVDIDYIVPKIINDTGDVINSLITQKQLYEQGTDANGAKLLHYSATSRYYGRLFADFYGGYYWDLKQYLNSRTSDGAPDLKLSGDLYAAMKTTVIDKDKYLTTSSVDYFEKVQLRYGEASFRLSPQNKGIYAQNTVRPLLMQYVHDKTKL